VPELNLVRRMLRIAVVFLCLDVGVATAQPSTKAPVIDGSVRAVSTADVNAAIAEVRRCVNLYRKTLDLGPAGFYVGIYRVHIKDHNTIWIYRRTTQGRTPTRVVMRRVEGGWQTTTVGLASIQTPNQSLEPTAGRRDAQI
jgi:hypothetical protein